MVDGIRCPSDDGFFSDESSNNIYGQVTLSHVDAVDGGAAQSGGEIDVNTVVDDHRHSIAHRVGYLGHKNETLSS